MKVPLFVKSNYYKGLLVLSRRDRIIDDRERELLIQVGAFFDFDKRFCETTINELLVNAHISRRPIVFSDSSVKECFFRDAMRVAYSDACMHHSELSWLRRAAHANGMSDEWLDDVIREFQGIGPIPRNFSIPLDIEKYL